MSISWAKEKNIKAEKAYFRVLIKEERAIFMLRRYFYEKVA